jgi:predicted component of type VI protein secretion system
MKTNRLAQRRYEKTLAQCASRARLWREYVASYEKVLEESPREFSAFSAEFRERYLRCSVKA